MVIGSDSKGINQEEIERLIGKSKILHRKPKLFRADLYGGRTSG